MHGYHWQRSCRRTIDIPINDPNCMWKEKFVLNHFSWVINKWRRQPKRKEREWERESTTHIVHSVRHLRKPDLFWVHSMRQIVREIELNAYHRQYPWSIMKPFSTHKSSLAEKCAFFSSSLVSETKYCPQLTNATPRKTCLLTHTGIRSAM